MMTAIERLRRDRGWSQERLADEASVSRNAIVFAEGRKRNPSVSTLVKLAAALEVPARILLADFAPDPEQAS